MCIYIYIYIYVCVCVCVCVLQNNTQNLVPILLGHFRPLKMRPLDCIETSGTKHLVKPRHIPEESRHKLNRCKNQKLKIMLIVVLNECGTSLLVLKVEYKLRVISNKILSDSLASKSVK